MNPAPAKEIVANACAITQKIDSFQPAVFRQMQNEPSIGPMNTLPVLLWSGVVDQNFISDSWLAGKHWVYPQEKLSANTDFEEADSVSGI
jgi:hypothetical protein